MAIVQDVVGSTLGSSTPASGFVQSDRFSPNSGTKLLTQVTKHASCDASAFEIRRVSDSAVVASGSFVGNVGAVNNLEMVSTEWYEFYPNVTGNQRYQLNFYSGGPKVKTNVTFSSYDAHARNLVSVTSTDVNPGMVASLISYYKLDESSGTVLDASGSNDGTNNSAVANSTGKINTGYNFTNGGTEQFISTTLAAGATAISGGSDMTFSAWIYPTDITLSDNMFMAIKNTGTPTSGQALWIGLSSGYVKIGQWGSDTASTTLCTQDEWQLITVTYTGGVYKIYRNGTYDSSVSKTKNLNSAYTLKIGSSDYSASHTWDGNIDEVGVWARELNSTEITALYNSGSGWAYPFPIAAAPTVTTTGSSLVEETTATVSGNVTDDGGATITERGVCYDTSTGPTTADSTQVVTGTTGTFDANLTGLSEGTPYFAKAYATNSAGTGYGSEVEFSTKPETITDFATGTITATSIALSWTKGTGAEKTEVRRKEGSYPTGPTDGDQVYFDTGVSVDDIGLDSYTTYYYRAWGWDTDSDYSDDYASLTAKTLYQAVSGILHFESGQLAQSTSVALNTGTITRATLTSTEVSGTFLYEMTADGTNWETVTSGVAHTFTNTGVDLRWRATENATSTGEISNIKIVYS